MVSNDKLKELCDALNSYKNASGGHSLQNYFHFNIFADDETFIGASAGPSEYKPQLTEYLKKLGLPFGEPPKDWFVSTIIKPKDLSEKTVSKVIRKLQQDTAKLVRRNLENEFETLQGSIDAVVTSGVTDEELQEIRSHLKALTPADEKYIMSDFKLDGRIQEKTNEITHN